jgi:hypothetical protein
MGILKLLAIILFLSPAICFGATYYVDATGGANGTLTAGLHINCWGGGGSGLMVQNNIFYNNACRDIVIKGVAVTTSGYAFATNNYYKASFTNNWNFKDTNYSTLATWQAAIDFSTKDTGSINTDPSFMSASNFTLTSSSPAINTGTGLCSTLTTATDMAGNAVCASGRFVGTGSAPDIGAYEYQHDVSGPGTGGLISGLGTGGMIGDLQ